MIGETTLAYADTGAIRTVDLSLTIICEANPFLAKGLLPLEVHAFASATVPPAVCATGQHTGYCGGLHGVFQRDIN